MVRRPPNVRWLGFTEEQTRLLDLLDFVGNNGWSRNGQSEELLPRLLANCEAASLSIDDIKAAMASIGYDKAALHQLARWESKRRTGRFGR